MACLTSCCTTADAADEAASGLWRSETMRKFDVALPREAAHDTVFQLGLLGCCQFIDSQAFLAAFQRPYTADIRRCEEALRRLRYIGEKLEKCKVVVAYQNVKTPITTANQAQLQGTSVPSLRRREREEQSASVPQASMMSLDRVEASSEMHERELRSIMSALGGMRREVRQLKESILVQNKVRVVSLYQSPATMVGSSQGKYGSDGGGAVEGGGATALSDRSIAGLIANAKLETFTRLVYRVSRGNAVLRLFPVDDPAALARVDDTFEEDEEDDGVSEDPMTESMISGGGVNEAIDGSQSVFVVYCYAPRMLEKIRKVCMTSSARIYDVGAPGATTGRHAQELDTLVSTYRQTKQQLYELLHRCSSGHEANLHFLRVEKTVLSTLNLFQFTDVMGRASLWIPALREVDVRAALIEGTRTSCAEAPTILTRSADQRHPPTFFNTNKYISIFQGIVDSYGIARYKEVNPGVFTIVTFPYLFGIMYGDMGHGVLLTLFAIALIALESRWEGKKQNEIFAMIFSGRYLLLLMGLFATYVGMLYNDFFGYSVGLFESSYDWPALPSNNGPKGVIHPLSPNGRPSIKPDRVYPFGIDVAWAETENKLEYYNSLKMKCAVIIGILQMLVGILLSLMNYLRRKEMFKVWCVFVPEFVFLTCTFGYMSVLIIIKWCTVWDNTHDAPSLLETMTNFFLSPGTVTKPLFEGQGGLQAFLLLLAFAMTPIMLLVAPRMEMRRHAARIRQRPAESCAEHADTNAAAADAEDLGDDDAPHDATEVTIHYIIHTIEFVLGAVSNTASYLRLWALSLAHAQLSEVFFRFGIVQVLGMDTTGAITFIGAGVWFGATIGVLLGMEALSAFLHSLRLHWVEFQNKFYQGDGHAFAPLDLVALQLLDMV